MYNQITQKNRTLKDNKERFYDVMEKYESSLNTSSIIRSYYDEIKENFEQLSTTYDDLEDFYRILQENYYELETQYLELDGRYITLLHDKYTLEQTLQQDISKLEQELSNIANFMKNITWGNTNYVIQPFGNITFTYETEYAGFLEVNYSSSSEIIIWIGSSVTDSLYYARIPFAFPNTTVNGTFRIPACCSVYVYIINPSDSLTARVDLRIMYYY